MADLTYSPANPIAGILQGFAQSMQQSHQDDMAERMKYRETILGQLDNIINHPDEWGEKSVQEAYQAKLNLMVTPPDKKWPTEWERGKNGEMPAALEPIVRPGLSKKLAKNGPPVPAEPPPPPPPADPGAIAEPPPPPAMADPSTPPAVGAVAEQFALQPPPNGPGDMGQMAQPAVAQPTMDPIAGGAQLGPNAISPAPAIPGQPMPPAGMPAAAPGVPEPPWTVPEYGRLNPEDQARRQAGIARIKQAIPDELADALEIPKGTSLQGAKEIRLREKEEVAANVALANMELTKAKALRERAAIENDAAKVQALLQQADAATERAQAAMVAANRPAGQGRGFARLVIKDDFGGNVGLWDRSSNTLIPAPEGITGTRTTGIATEERKSAGNIDDMLEREIPELRALATEYKNWLGPVAGRAMKASVNWMDSLPEGVYRLVSLSANITAQRIYELSGKQINEAEAARLAAVLTNPATPPRMFMTNLDLLEKQLKAVRGKNATGRGGGATVTVPPRPDSGDAKSRLEAIKQSLAGVK